MNLTIFSILKNLGIGLLLVLGIYFIFGLYYEEYTDTIFIAIYKGIFVGKADNVVNNYGVLTGLGQLYRYLYTLKNSVPWYGIFSIIYSTMILCNLIIISHIFFSKLEIKNSIKNILTIAIPFVLLFHYFALFQITKASFLLGISVIIILLFWHYKKIRISKLAFAYLAFCILILSMMRAEALLLLILFCGVTTLCCVGLRNTINLLVRIYSIPLLLSFIMLFLSTRNYNIADKEYSQISAYKVGAWDGGIDTSITHYTSKNDSIKHTAFCNFLISDRDSINLKLLTKYNTSAYDKKGNFLSNLTHGFKHRLKHGILTLITSFRVAGYFTIIMILGFILLFLSLPNKKNRIKFLFANAIFIATIGFVSIVLKMEERVLVPLTLGQLLLCYILLYDYFIFKRNKTSILLGLCSIFILIQFSRKIEVLIERKAEYNTIVKYHNDIIEKCSNKTLVINIFSWNILAPGVLNEDYLTSKLKANNTQILGIDNGYVALHPSYINYITKIAGSAHYVDIISYLKENKNNIYYLSSAKRFDFFTTYCNTIYSANLVPETVQTYNGIKSNITGEVNFYLYKYR